MKLKMALKRRSGRLTPALLICVVTACLSFNWQIGYSFAFTTKLSFSSASRRSIYNPATKQTVQTRRANCRYFRYPSSERSRTFDLRAGHISEPDAVDENKVEKDENDKESMTDFEKVSRQVKLFIEMAMPYYKESSAAKYLFLGMILLTFLNSGVSVAFSYVSKDFWNALSSKNPEEFYTMLWKFAGALLVGSPVSVLYTFQREKLALSWREWMTDRTLQLYSSNRVYYALERGSEIDNPDQRIAEDVQSFTAFSLRLFLTLVTSTIDLVSFSFILYSIQPDLFGAIILYAIFGTITTAALGKNLVGLNYAKLQKEADFRYSLVRLRENAESIAFYAGEDIEGKEVSKRLEKVVDNKREINVAQRNLEFFTTSYNYFVQILPVAVVAPQYFAGAIQLGVVSQSAGAFNHILRDLSVIVNQFEQLSSFSAAIDRLSAFMTAIRDVDDSRNVDDNLLQLPPNTTQALEEEVVDHSGKISLRQNPPMSTSSSKYLLSLSNVTLTTPDMKRTLIEDLNFSIEDGQDLLIVGVSGAGKSSLLRAVAGLWTSGSGMIERPSDEDVYFLPQRPYCTLGTLKDQLLYPSLEEMKPDDYPEGHRLSRSHLLRQSLTDEDLLKICEDVDLGNLPLRAGDGDPVKGLNTVLDWSNTLSLGEQQRLAFGRLLVNQPRFVILDEATSALDMVGEAKMYKLLQNLSQKNTENNGLSSAGLTYVSVGHRPSLVIYHEKKLRLNGGGNYTFETIMKTSSEISPSGFVNNM